HRASGLGSHPELVPREKWIFGYRAREREVELARDGLRRLARRSVHDEARRWREALEQRQGACRRVHVRRARRGHVEDGVASTEDRVRSVPEGPRIEHHRGVSRHLPNEADQRLPHLWPGIPFRAEDREGAPPLTAAHAFNRERI